MTTTDLAKDFVALLKAHDHQGAGAKYNADDIVSYEAMEGPMAVARGKDAVKQKGEWWFGAHEVHRSDASGPYVNGDQFVVHFDIDVTEKASGKRVQMKEVGLYTVKNGKIVEERFFYGQG